LKQTSLPQSGRLSSLSSEEEAPEAVANVLNIIIFLKYTVFSAGKEINEKKIVYNIFSSAGGLKKILEIMNYLFARQHKGREEWECMFRCMLLLIKIYGEAEEPLPSDTKIIFSVIKSLLVEWGNNANRNNLKPEELWAVVTKGMSGGDMVNLMSNLVNIVTTKENLREVVVSDILRAILEAVMVDSVYPVYILAPSIKWNGMVAAQKILMNASPEDVQILLNDKELLSSVGDAFIRAGKAKDFKHAVLLMYGLINLV
jgi:hypothetical protein